MTQKTKSEILFEQYCDQLDIDCTPIPRADTKTPDYELVLGAQLVIAELKQLDLNNEDSSLFERARVSGSASAWPNSANRVRRKIQRAGRQLKARSKGRTPALVVIYDNGTSGGVDGTDVRTAMYGDETVDVSLFPGGADVTPLHAGGNRRLTEKCNTTISAVGVLYRLTTELSISLFHNHFAANPIGPSWFRHSRLRHFALSSDSYDWTEI